MAPVVRDSWLQDKNKKLLNRLFIFVLIVVGAKSTNLFLYNQLIVRVIPQAKISNISLLHLLKCKDLLFFIIFFFLFLQQIKTFWVFGLLTRNTEQSEEVALDSRKL